MAKPSPTHGLTSEQASRERRIAREVLAGANVKRIALREGITPSQVSAIAAKFPPAAPRPERPQSRRRRRRS